MENDNKAVGSLAASKLVTLIKAETAKKYDKTGGKIEGSAEITGGLKVGMSSEFSSSIKAGSEISSDMLLMAPIVALHDPATEESISFGVSGENAAKVTSPVSGGGTQYARLSVGTPTGDNDAATKAYVDGRTHDYYDVTVTSSAGASQTIDGGIISVRGSSDKTVAEISAAYAAGNIVRCIYNGNIMQLVRAADGSYSFAGVGANYGVARSGNITITIMSTSNGDVTWITSAAGELPIPDSDVSQNGCVLVVGNGQWMYSADKFIPATPTSNGLMSAADKAKLDRMDSYYDVTVTTSAGAEQTIDGGIISVRGSADKTVAEIAAAYAAGAIVRCIYDGNIMQLVRVSDGSYSFAGVGANYGVARDGNITVTIMSTTSSGDVTWITSAAGELPIPDSDGSRNGCVLVVGDGKWMYSADKLIPATPTSNGLMSAADKAKLDSIDSACYDIYAKIGTADTHDSVYKYGCTVSHTFAEINAAVHAGKTPRVLLVNNIDNPSDTRIICPLSEYDTSRSEGGYYFDAPGLVGVSGSGRIYIDENGAMYTCSAGELPAVDANQDGKYLMIDGGMWTYRLPDTATATAPGFMSAKDKAKLDAVDDGANKTVVDASLDADSTNPVQNKAVKAALDGKLSTLGGEISGHLSVGLTVSAEGSVSVGRTSADTGIHFEKAASDAGRISHGSDPMTGVSPIARLKVADPTDDDDAATKKYVDGRAVRYDAAQGLTSDQKFVACANIGAVNQKGAWMEGNVALLPRGADGAFTINITPSEKSNDYTLTLDAGPENVPVYVAGLETPTDAQTDCAANVAYVKAKIAEVAASGGVDVDNALSATSTNPVQNKVITSAMAGKADKTALNSKADKTALDAKADKTALDAKMDKSGGTFTGNVYGKYFCGTWLQSTAASDLGRAPGKIAVLDDSGWVYYRTPAELLADIGAMSGGDYYTKAETDAAIAVRASTSAYGTTKLSNSTTSSSKTLAATPYAVKTALAQAKAYVDSSIAVAINSAY